MREEDESGGRTLRQATLDGVRWAAYARVAVEIVGLAAMVALARLIAPAEFGHAVIALIANTLAIILTYEFIAVPLVQARSVTREQLGAAMLASVALGAVLGVATFLFGVLAAATVFDARTADLIQLAAPAFLLGGLGAVPRAILHRRLDFAGLSLVEVISTILGLITAVALAIAGLDGQAIVLGALVTTAASTIQLSVRAPLPRPCVRRGGLRPLAAFGLASGLSATTGVAFRNIDFAIIGARLDATQLGYYWRGFQLGIEHQGKISSVMIRIALPVYSRTTNLDEMRALRRRITRAHATVILPLQAALIALAPVLIPWLFGPRWEPAVLPTQILAVAGMLTAILSGVTPLVLAVGRPRPLLAYNLVSCAVYGATVFFVAPYGLTAVCIAVVAVYAVQFACAQFFLLQRLVGIPVRDLRYDVGPGAISSAALLAVTMAFTQLASAIALPDLVTLMVSCALAAGTYLLALRTFFPSAWQDIELLVGLILRRRAPVAPPGTPVSVGASAKKDQHGLPV